MARPRKEGQYINVRVAQDVYDRIDEICAEAGHTKSYVVEKALSDFIEDYEAKQEALQSIKDGSARLVKTEKYIKKKDGANNG